VKLERKLKTKIRYFINWVMMKKWEVKFLESFHKCITVSFLNKQILNSINPKLDISVIENGVDVDNYRPLPINSGTKNILFIGLMNYVANHDAALYFYNEIFPIIKKHIPYSKFFIVGRKPKQEIRELTKDKNVIVTGYVDDVRSYYKDCDISVVPLRAGGGTRLKILEAMALGRPVVSTTIGCEGLDVVNGRHLLIADDAQQFTEKTLRLLSDKKLYKRIVREARQLAVARYGWDAIAEQLLDVYSRMTR
ncbi:glycosyltransferase, partial [bacterium]|nr:glycosyltransferase [bacterium]